VQAAIRRDQRAVATERQHPPGKPLAGECAASHGRYQSLSCGRLANRMGIQLGVHLAQKTAFQLAHRASSP